MTIRVKDTLYGKEGGNSFIVRQGTIGVERDKIVYFYDNTKSMAIGFPRDVCLNTPALFSVQRTIEDREVSVRDVVKIVENARITKDVMDEITTEILSL